MSEDDDPGDGASAAEHERALLVVELFAEWVSAIIVVVDDDNNE